jgi:hypothetical protein
MCSKSPSRVGFAVKIDLSCSNIEADGTKEIAKAIGVNTSLKKFSTTLSQTIVIIKSKMVAHQR